MVLGMEARGMLVPCKHSATEPHPQWGICRVCYFHWLLLFLTVPLLKCFSSVPSVRRASREDLTKGITSWEMTDNQRVDQLGHHIYNLGMGSLGLFHFRKGQELALCLGVPQGAFLCHHCPHGGSLPSQLRKVFGRPHHHDVQMHMLYLCHWI